MRRVFAPRILVALVFLSAVLAYAGLTDRGSRRHEPVQASVIRVVDGDTLKVSGFGAKPETVRLIGVDTPETVSPRLPRDATGHRIPQCYGLQASAFTKHALPPGSAVQLRFDADAPPRDHFGRLLVYVYEHAGQGPMLNLELVRQGYARAAFYKPHDDYRQLFKTAEAKAKQADRGRWKACRA